MSMAKRNVAGNAVDIALWACSALASWYFLNKLLKKLDPSSQGLSEAEVESLAAVLCRRAYAAHRWLPSRRSSPTGWAGR